MRNENNKAPAGRRTPKALEENMRAFGVELEDETIERLTRYYELVVQWNPRLHLVAHCSPEEFATRHILESLLLLKYIDQNQRVVDVGSGAGLPIIPCLIARPDLSAVMIESSTKKSVFLREVLRQLELAKSGSVMNARFEDIDSPDASYLTCRALDQFSSKVSTLINWTKVRTILFFGGASLAEKLKVAGMEFQEERIPNSERRSLFVIRR